MDTRTLGSAAYKKLGRRAPGIILRKQFAVDMSSTVFAATIWIVMGITIVEGAIRPCGPCLCYKGRVICQRQNLTAVPTLPAHQMRKAHTLDFRRNYFRSLDLTPVLRDYPLLSVVDMRVQLHGECVRVTGIPSPRFWVSFIPSLSPFALERFIYRF